MNPWDKDAEHLWRLWFTADYLKHLKEASDGTTPHDAPRDPQSGTSSPSAVNGNLPPC